MAFTSRPIGGLLGGPGYTGVNQFRDNSAAAAARPNVAPPAMRTASIPHTMSPRYARPTAKRTYGRK
jgi:hypothetical protein